jgi:hypothetical protein
MAFGSAVQQVTELTPEELDALNKQAQADQAAAAATAPPPTPDQAPAQVSAAETPAQDVATAQPAVAPSTAYSSDPLTDAAYAEAGLQTPVPPPSPPPPAADLTPGYSLPTTKSNSPPITPAPDPLGAYGAGTKFTGGTVATPYKPAYLSGTPAATQSDSQRGGMIPRPDKVPGTEDRSAKTDWSNLTDDFQAPPHPKDDQHNFGVPPPSGLSPSDQAGLDWWNTNYDPNLQVLGGGDDPNAIGARPGGTAPPIDLGFPGANELGPNMYATGLNQLGWDVNQRVAQLPGLDWGDVAPAAAAGIKGAANIIGGTAERVGSTARQDSPNAYGSLDKGMVWMPVPRFGKGATWEEAAGPAPKVEGNLGIDPITGEVSVIPTPRITRSVSLKDAGSQEIGGVSEGTGTRSGRSLGVDPRQFARRPPEEAPPTNPVPSPAKLGEPTPSYTEPNVRDTPDINLVGEPARIYDNPTPPPPETSVRLPNGRRVWGKSPEGGVPAGFVEAAPTDIGVADLEIPGGKRAASEAAVRRNPPEAGTKGLQGAGQKLPSGLTEEDLQTWRDSGGKTVPGTKASPVEGPTKPGARPKTVDDYISSELLGEAKPGPTTETGQALEGGPEAGSTEGATTTRNGKTKTTRVTTTDGVFDVPADSIRKVGKGQEATEPVPNGFRRGVTDAGDTVDVPTQSVRRKPGNTGGVKPDVGADSTKGTLENLPKTKTALEEIVDAEASSSGKPITDAQKQQAIKDAAARLREWTGAKEPAPAGPTTEMRPSKNGQPRKALGEPGGTRPGEPFTTTRDYQPPPGEPFTTSRDYQPPPGESFAKTRNYQPAPEDIYSTIPEELRPQARRNAAKPDWELSTDPVTGDYTLKPTTGGDTRGSAVRPSYEWAQDAETGVYTRKQTKGGDAQGNAARPTYEWKQDPVTGEYTMKPTEGGDARGNAVRPGYDGEPVPEPPTDAAETATGGKKFPSKKAVIGAIAAGAGGAAILQHRMSGDAGKRTPAQMAATEAGSISNPGAYTAYNQGRRKGMPSDAYMVDASTATGVPGYEDVYVFVDPSTKQPTGYINEFGDYEPPTDLTDLDEIKGILDRIQANGGSASTGYVDKSGKVVMTPGPDQNTSIPVSGTNRAGETVSFNASPGGTTSWGRPYDPVDEPISPPVEAGTVAPNATGAGASGSPGSGTPLVKGDAIETGSGGSKWVDYGSRGYSHSYGGSRYGGKRKKKKGSFSGGDSGGFWPGFPFNRPNSPIRQHVLDAIAASLAKSKYEKGR